MIDNSKEYILCAAIKTCLYNKPIICGFRHSDIFRSLKELNVQRENTLSVEQGFLTSKKRFVDREEAKKIAFEAGQVKDSEGGLFSEDLY